MNVRTPSSVPAAKRLPSRRSVCVDEHVALLLGVAAEPAARVAARALGATEHHERIRARVDEADVDALAVVVNGVLAHALVARAGRVARGDRSQRAGAADASLKSTRSFSVSGARSANRRIAPARDRRERGGVEHAARLRRDHVRRLDVAGRIHGELDVDVPLDAALARGRGILGRAGDQRLELLRGFLRPATRRLALPPAAAVATGDAAAVVSRHTWQLCTMIFGLSVRASQS